MTDYKGTIAKTLTKIEQAVGLKRRKVTVLTYHSISADDTIVDVDPSEFRKQIEWLINEGFEFLSLNEVVSYLKGNKKINKPSVCLTFDDGYADILDEVVSLLRDSNIPASVFVLSDRDHVDRDELENDKKLLTYRDIKKLINLGWEIGSHSATHDNFSSINTHLVNEIVNSKKVMEKKLGIKVLYFSYPKGIINSKVAKLVKQANYHAGFGVGEAKLGLNTDLVYIPRIGIDRSHTLLQFQSLFSNWYVVYSRFKKFIVIHGSRILRHVKPEDMITERSYSG